MNLDCQNGFGVTKVRYNVLHVVCGSFVNCVLKIIMKKKLCFQHRFGTCIIVLYSEIANEEFNPSRWRKHGCSTIHVGTSWQRTRRPIMYMLLLKSKTSSQYLPICTIIQVFPTKKANWSTINFRTWHTWLITKILSCIHLHGNIFSFFFSSSDCVEYVFKNVPEMNISLDKTKAFFHFFAKFGLLNNLE